MRRPSRVKNAIYYVISAVTVVIAVWLWTSSEGISTKLLGTLGLLVVQGLIGWYGAALEDWLRDRRINKRLGRK